MKVFNIVRFLVLVSSLTIAGCSGSGIEIVDEPYAFSNPIIKNVEHDDCIKIDGIIDEDIYSNQRWFDYNYLDISRVRFTVYLGEKGVFLATMVDDTGVYCNPLKSSTNNSGLEFYIAGPEATKEELNVFEIDMNASGQYNAKIRMQNVYTAYGGGPTYNNDFLFVSNPIGKINTDECKGYIQEAFFSYGYLRLKEIPEFVNVNCALIRADSMNVNDSGRVWYNFGVNQKIGLKTYDPSTYFRFYKNGFYSHDVTATVNDTSEGSIVVDNQSPYHGENSRILINVNDGYCVKSILENNDYNTKHLTYIGKNTYEYQVDLVEKDTTVIINFDGKTPANAQINGHINLLDAEHPEWVYPDLKVWALSNGINYGLTLDTSGNYSGQIPNGEFDLYIEDFYNKIIYQKVGLDTTNNDEYELDLYPLDYSSTSKAEMYHTSALNKEGQAYLYSCYRSGIDGDITTNSFIKMTQVFEAPIIKDDALNPDFGCNTGIGYIALTSKFYFYENVMSEDYVGGFTTEFLLYNNRWYFKIYLDNPDSPGGRDELKPEYQLNISQLKKLSGKGIDIQVSVCGGDYSFYLDRGDGVMELIHEGHTSASLVCKYGDIFVRGINGYKFKSFNNYFYQNFSI